MAIRATKFNRQLRKLLRKPSVLGAVLLLLSVIKDFVNHEFHARVFESGIIKVVDGDTIVLDNTRIRLQGVDAPELKQNCMEKESEKIWPCGVAAKEYLIKLIGQNNVSCTNEGFDKYKRQLSYCYAGDINLNRAMVRDGFASSYTKFDVLFFVDEISAKLEKKGIWGSEFDDPETWRKKQKH